MTTEHSINYKGFDFDFKYNYTPGRPSTWEDPEEYEEFEIFEITLIGIYAEDLLYSMIEDFEEEAIKSIRSYYE